SHPDVDQRWAVLVVVRRDGRRRRAAPRRRLVLLAALLPGIRRQPRDPLDSLEVAFHRADRSDRIHISPQVVPAKSAAARSRANRSASRLRSSHCFSAARTSAIASWRQTCTARNQTTMYAATPQRSARSTASKNGRPAFHATYPENAQPARPAHPLATRM